MAIRVENVTDQARTRTAEDLLRDVRLMDAGHYRVKEVRAHATGLRLPGHMGLLSDGRLLVSEFAGGKVRDITKPGDYADETSGQWAWDLEHPGGILPLSDGRVLVADSGGDRIYDITEAGPTSDVNLVFDRVPHPYSLVEFKERLFVSWSSDTMVGMVEVRAGGEFESEEASFVHGFPVVLASEPYPYLMGCGGDWSGTGFKPDTGEERLFLGHSALGAIFDVTEGGNFGNVRDKRYAWGLNLPLGMIADPIDGNIYVTERMTGAIKRVPRSGGYSRFAEPLLTGFRDPNCIRFTRDGTRAYVCDRAVGTVYRVELEHVD